MNKFEKRVTIPCHFCGHPAEYKATIYDFNGRSTGKVARLCGLCASRLGHVRVVASQETRRLDEADVELYQKELAEARKAIRIRRRGGQDVHVERLVLCR